MTQEKEPTSTPISLPEPSADMAVTFVPERRRGATVLAAAPLVTGAGSDGGNTGKMTSPDSYQPPRTGSTAVGAPPSERGDQQLVRSTASIDSILGEVRRAPAARLDVEGRTASGGMGAIDVAVDRALDRRIALKTLHPHLRSNEAAVRMFLREARLTGLLDHPHIVPVYDIGERDADRLYFSMKLVEGQTLEAIIRALPTGPLDLATLFTLLGVVLKVCDALAFAHSRGVIHCDIKPANVMVGEFGQVYVMDWGIARLVSTDGAPPSEPAVTVPGGRHDRPVEAGNTDNSVIGTPCYMSPEQARGDRGKLDPRSDVFLLGTLLYEILTRRPPYVSKDRGETLDLAAAGSYPPPRHLSRDRTVPQELERIVLRAMAKLPADRYPSVTELREDLARFMRGGGDFPRKTFQPGETIIQEGEPGDSAYIILAGRCEITKSTAVGDLEVENTLGPGDVFGETAILTESSRTATVVAIEPTTVLVVTAAVLEQELAALKPWMATLLKSLASRFRDIDARHRATYAAGPNPTRLANQVLMALMTWGEPVPGAAQARTLRWTDLAADLEAQLGAAPLSIFGVVGRYGMTLDLEGDRLTVGDVAALRAKLATELGR